MESIVPGLEGRKASGGVYASLSRGVYSLLEGCTVYWLWGGVQLIEGCTFVESWWTNTVQLPAPGLPRPHRGAFGEPVGQAGIFSEDHSRHEAPLNGASDAPKAPPWYLSKHLSGAISCTLGAPWERFMHC